MLGWWFVDLGEDGEEYETAVSESSSCESLEEEKGDEEVSDEEVEDTDGDDEVPDEEAEGSDGDEMANKKSFAGFSE